MRLEFVIIKKFMKIYKEDKNKIYSMDNKYSSLMTYEYSKASTNIGYNYYTQIKNHISKSVVQNYFDAIENKK